MSSDADDREVTPPWGRAAAEGPDVDVLAEALRGEAAPLAWAKAFSRVFAVTATRRSTQRVFAGDDFTGLLADWLASAMERGAQTERDREGATAQELVVDAFLEHADRLHELARNLAPDYVAARKARPSREAVSRAFAQAEQNERRGLGLDEDVPADGSPYAGPMPVFVIKARDNLSVEAIEAYRGLCVKHGLYAQAGQVVAARDEVEAWRAAHPEACKWPDHEHAPAGQPGSGA